MMGLDIRRGRMSGWMMSERRYLVKRCAIPRDLGSIAERFTARGGFFLTLRLEA